MLFPFGSTVLLINKAVVREGEQSHFKFKNQKKKTSKFKTSIDIIRSWKSQEAPKRLVPSGSAATSCADVRDSSTLRGCSPIL